MQMNELNPMHRDKDGPKGEIHAKVSTCCLERFAGIWQILPSTEIRGESARRQSMLFSLALLSFVLGGMAYSITHTCSARRTA